MTEFRRSANGQDFRITNVTNFGDAEKDTQVVLIHHDCPTTPGKTQELKTGFGSVLSAEQVVTCPTCSGSVTIVKDRGTVFMQPQK
jgi:hypothetical protein